MYNKDDYAISEVGEYAIYIKNYEPIQLKSILKDKIVKSSKYKFIVIEQLLIPLGHVKNVLNMDNNISCDIFSEHIAYKIDTDNKCIIETFYKDCKLINVSTDYKVEYQGALRFVFKIGNIISMREKSFNT